MNIAFDLDEVLASFQAGWIEFNNLNYGTSLKYEDITTYSYEKIMNLPGEEVFRRIFELYDSEIIKNLAPTEGAVAVVRALSGKHELYVLTSRPDEIRAITVNWTTKHFKGCFREVLFSGNISRAGFSKNVTKADLCRQYELDWLVEDAPIYAKLVAKAGFNVALLEKPWNVMDKTQHSRIFRLRSISEFPNLLKK